MLGWMLVDLGSVSITPSTSPTLAKSYFLFWPFSRWNGHTARDLEWVQEL